MVITIPRRFLLQEEHRKSTKGLYDGISFGLIKDDDITFTEWYGSIYASDILNFNVVCNKNYPKEPPKITFDKKYIDIDYDDIPETMYNMIIKMKELCNDELEINHNIINKWNENMTLGKYLEIIRKKIC